MTANQCGFCNKSLLTPGLGKQTLPCGHAVHEQCAFAARRQCGAKCPFCGHECFELMDAETLYQKALAKRSEGLFEESAHLARQALDLDVHPKAATLLGIQLAQGKGVDENIPKAMELLQVGVDFGDADAAGILGSILCEGRVVNKDMSKALKLLKKAHEAGNRQATSILGSLYLHGKDVRKDLQAALDYFMVSLHDSIQSRSYIQDTDAFFLGIMCLHGQGLPQDEFLALLLLEISHKKDNAAASLALADHYKTKRKDFVKAAEYYEASHWSGLACGKPHANPPWCLGLFYMSGTGVDVDHNKGLHLMLTARHLGHPEGALIPQLLPNSSPKDLANMEMLAKAVFAPADATDFSPSALRAQAAQQWMEINTHGVMPRGVQSPFVTERNDEASRSIPRSSQPTFRVLILEYSRHPEVLRHALLEGDGLRACRIALHGHGFSAELRSQAKIFVRPDQYEAVVEAVEHLELRAYHVVTTDEYEKAVIDTVKSLPSKAQVREKSRKTIDEVTCQVCSRERPRFECQRCNSVRYCSQACQKKDWTLHKPTCVGIVKRTFIDVPIKSSLRSSPASGDKTKSTTDADVRKGMNPRLA